MIASDYSSPNNNIIAFKSSSDPDTMYYHEGMKAPDREKFREAMQMEVDDHTKNGHLKIINQNELLTGVRVLPAVWSMRRKRKIATQQVYKWKASLTVDGSKQWCRVDYDQTYSPVVTWPATRFFFILSLINGLHTRQLDFLLAYTQPDLERDLYMELPKGINLPGHEKGQYVLQLVKTLYGQKQAGRVWHEHLKLRLKEMNFKQSSIDECVFYYKQRIFIVYVNDTILLGPDKKRIG